MSKDLKLLLLAVAISAMVCGTVLRVAGFNWNSRIHGDVNLFALTAREFVDNGRLYYPMKFEYSDFVKYQVLRSPASQHPPLWPAMAGLLGKLFSTEDTFFILKILCEVTGFFLMAVVAYFGIRAGCVNETLISISCIALSPMLVDFSANGSPYILSALMIVLATILLKRFDYQRTTHYIFSGVLCGVAIQVHSALMFLPLAFIVFGLWERSKIKRYGVIAFVLAGILVIAPWVSWNWSHFGRPFYSYSSYYLLKKLGLAHTGLYGEVITTRITGTVDIQLLMLYVSLVYQNTVVLLKQYLFEIGPFCAVLAIIGCVQLFKYKRRDALAFFLPYVFYALVIFLWATNKYRFLVPALPAAYMSASIGFTGLYYSRNFALKLLGVICLIGALVWGIPGFLEETPTRYYQDDDKHALQYSKMLPLARELKRLGPGVVLGYSNSLDGGGETVYWHGLPFVYGRGLSMNEIHKLVHDFDIRYFWADRTTVHQIESGFPGAKLILSNGVYYVFEI